MFTMGQLLPSGEHDDVTLWKAKSLGRALPPVDRKGNEEAAIRKLANEWG